MSRANFEHQVDVKRYQAEVGRDDFINAYGAKGPTILFQGQEPVYIVTDRKSSDYPNKGIAGKLVFRGGNWKNILQTSPEQIYRDETREELKLPEQRLNRDIVAFADYFTALPEDVVRNPN